jgi:hypothetical protein
MNDRPVSTLVQELATRMAGLARSEIQLALAEFKSNAQNAARQSRSLALYFSLLFLGALALLTSVIIGLGQVLGNRFGWSSLMVGLGLTAMGLGGALRSLRTLQLRPKHPKESLFYGNIPHSSRPRRQGPPSAALRNAR